MTPIRCHQLIVLFLLLAGAGQVLAGEHWASVSVNTHGAGGPITGPGPVQHTNYEQWYLPPGAPGRGWAISGKNVLQGWGEVNHVDTGVYEHNTHSRSKVTWDDVIFSAPTNTTIGVNLNMNVAGSYTAIPQSGVYALANVAVALYQDNYFNLGHWDSNGPNQGVLSGYDGIGPYNFSTPVTLVPTNTPVTIIVSFSPGANASIQGLASFNQTLRMGHVSGAPIFNVPAGVTVNSVQAGIVNNGAVPDAQVYADSNPDTLMAGDFLTVSTWNGTPGSPALLMIWSVNGVVMPTPALFSVLDADGRLDLSLVMPPYGVGLTLGVRTYSLNANNGIVLSDLQDILLL